MKTENILHFREIDFVFSLHRSKNLVKTKWGKNVTPVELSKARFWTPTYFFYCLMH